MRKGIHFIIWNNTCENIYDTKIVWVGFWRRVDKKRSFCAKNECEFCFAWSMCQSQRQDGMVKIIFKIYGKLSQLFAFYELPCCIGLTVISYSKRFDRKGWSNPPFTRRTIREKRADINGFPFIYSTKLRSKEHHCAMVELYRNNNSKTITITISLKWPATIVSWF